MEAIPRTRTAQTNAPDTTSPPSSGFSTQATRNSKGYWNNLLCMFEGLSFDPTTTAGATSLNNKEYFQSSSRPLNAQSTQGRPRSKTFVPKRSDSTLRASAVTPRRASSSGILGRMRRGRSSVDSTDLTLSSVPEANAINTSARPITPSAAAMASPQEPRMIAVQKDGQTIWIPEAVVQQYSQPSTDNDRPPSSKRHKRPDMKITIPPTSSQTSLAVAHRRAMHASSKSEGSIYSDAAGNTVVITRSGERLLSPSPDNLRPVHPLEHKPDQGRTSMGASPTSPHSRNSSHSSGDWSAASSQYSVGTSRSSIEVLTPKDTSPTSSVSQRSLPGGKPKAQQSLDSCVNQALPIQPRNLARASMLPGNATESQMKPESVLPPTPNQHLGSVTPPIPRRSVMRAAPVPQAVYHGRNTSSHRSRQSFSDLSKLVNEQKHASDATRISPDTAESVIYEIFLRLPGLEDLISLARINHGFYDVFKRNELELVETVLRKSDPAAWEHLEVSPSQKFVSSVSLLERPCAGQSFFSQYCIRLRQDTYTLVALKKQILERCQSFVRSKTIEALNGSHHERAARFDNALWRIWTFCDMFGARTKCEHDLAAQISWLRGFPGRTSSGSIPNAHYPCPKLLYGMTEIWNCMRALLSGLQGPGRLAQARKHGVFKGHEEIPIDVPAMQEYALEEWINYLLTLGPEVVLELSKHATDSSDAVFALAASKGWTVWNPPSPLYGKISLSRRNFLKGAVSRVYEEKVIAEAKAAGRTPKPSISIASRSSSTSCDTHNPERTTTQSRHWALVARRARGQALASQLKELKAEHAAARAAASAGCLPDELKIRRISDERPMSLLAEVRARERARLKKRMELQKSKLSTVTKPDDMPTSDDLTSSSSKKAENAPTSGVSTPRASPCAAKLNEPFTMPPTPRVIHANADTDAEDLTPTIETPLVYPPNLALLMDEALSKAPPVPKLCLAAVASAKAQIVTPAPPSGRAPKKTKKPADIMIGPRVSRVEIYRDEVKDTKERPPVLSTEVLRCKPSRSPVLSPHKTSEAPAARQQSSPPQKPPVPAPAAPTRPPPPPPLDLEKVAARLALHRSRRESQYQQIPAPLKPTPKPISASENRKTSLAALREMSTDGTAPEKSDSVNGETRTRKRVLTTSPVPRSKYTHAPPTDVNKKPTTLPNVNTTTTSNWSPMSSISSQGNSTSPTSNNKLDSIVSPLSAQSTTNPMTSHMGGATGTATIVLLAPGPSPKPITSPSTPATTQGKSPVIRAITEKKEIDTSTPASASIPATAPALACSSQPKHLEPQGRRKPGVSAVTPHDSSRNPGDRRPLAQPQPQPHVQVKLNTTPSMPLMTPVNPNTGVKKTGTAPVNASAKQRVAKKGEKMWVSDAMAICGREVAGGWL